MFDEQPSKSRIDRLGNRLRKGETHDDLRFLDSYRRSFGNAYEKVVMAIRNELDLEPTGRTKSNASILDKLRRESIRLSQMQDIAGCRLVLSDVNRQNQVVESLAKIFTETQVVDRRLNSSNGYRAVHVIADVDGRLVEVQVRTSLQHKWAELSEKVSDVVDPLIKYGAGDKEALMLLGSLSRRIEKYEMEEFRLARIQYANAAQKQDIIDFLEEVRDVLLPEERSKE